MIYCVCHANTKPPNGLRISLFLLAYPIPQTAAQLTLAEFKAFATAHAYPHPQQLPAALARLRDPYPVAAATTVEVYAGEA